MLNSSEALVGVTGRILSCKTSDIIEYGAFGDLPVGTIDHGYAGDEGVKFAGNRSVTNKVAWQGAVIVRALVTESGLTVSFTLIQTNDDNMKLATGRAKNAVTGGYHWNLGDTGGLRTIIIDVIDEARGKKLRYYLPEAEITEVGEIVIASGEIIAYPLTATSYAKEVEGETAHMIIWEDDLANDPALVTP